MEFLAGWVGSYVAASGGFDCEIPAVFCCVILLMLPNCPLPLLLSHLRRQPPSLQLKNTLSCHVLTPISIYLFPPLGDAINHSHILISKG